MISSAWIEIRHGIDLKSSVFSQRGQKVRQCEGLYNLLSVNIHVAGRKNSESVQRQIDKAERKLDEILVVSRPSLKNEDGDDMMEIIEELDEDGNITCTGFPC
jgi:hypothetical protein